VVIDLNKYEVVDNFNVSDKLGLDDNSKPVTGFFEPLICACFMPKFQTQMDLL
jgi:hypothetical protein